MIARQAQTPVSAIPRGTEEPFQAARLEQVFARCFEQQWRTRLQGGAGEPLYQPAPDSGQLHKIYYRADYFASALHEVAHWCIAGERRRQLVDYGYWYAPDGRNQAQQQAFESAEFKPQALEWWFARACGYHFRISVDNLESAGVEEPDTTAFARRICAQAQQWQRQGLPRRAGLFFEGLCQEFGRSLAPASLEFTPAALA